MNIKKVLFVTSSMAIVALTSCGGSGLRHTISKVNNVYQADLDHSGFIEEYEKGLTWEEAYDTLISEANSMEALNLIADQLNIDPNEEKRTSLARYEILHEAEELAMSTGAVLPIYNYGDPYLLKPNVKGISSMDLGFKFLDRLSYTDSSSKKFVVSVGTKAESFDPAVNTDVSTTIATNQFLIGAKRYVRGEEEVDDEGKGRGTYIAKLADGVCTLEKRLVTSDPAVTEIEENWIPFDKCDDLVSELNKFGTDEETKKAIRDAYEGTARYTIILKDGAVWNDGSNITVDDFIYAWARASSGIYNGQPIGMWCNMFDMIRGYNAWSTVGQQASLEAAKESDGWSELSEVEQFQYEYHWNETGCAGGMAGVMNNNDGKSFTVQLVNDCDYFESLLAFPAFMPVAKKNIIIPNKGKEYEKTHICKEDADWWLNKNGEYLTNGPLQIDGKIDNIDSGGMKLKKAEHATPGVLDPEGSKDPTISNLEFKFIDKDSTIYDSYKSDAIQFTNQFPSAVIDPLMKKPDWHVAPQIGLFFYDFNVNDNTFDIKKETDKFSGERNREKLRKVIALLMNRDDIANNVAKKGCTAANGFVSDGVIEGCIPEWSSAKNAYIAAKNEDGTYKTANWHTRNKDMSQYWADGTYKDHYMGNRTPGGFFPTAFEGDGEKEMTEQEVMEQNTAEAIELAKEAGINYDKNTGKFTNFPHISLITNNGSGLEDIAERFQYYCSLWGINISIQTQEWQSFLATRRAGQFALARQGWVADYNDPRTYLDLCTSTSGNNDTQLGKDNWHNSR